MKKRMMGITLALSVLMLIVSPIMPQKTAHAFQTYTISNGEYIWYEVENNEATFCGYINYNAVVTEYEIPSEIKGYPVTAVEVMNSYDFNVKKLVIPDTVKTIKKNGFAYCTSLEEVEMGANVEIIEDIAFSDCTSLEKITLSPKVTTIGNNAFYGCSALKEIVIPDSVTSIGQFAFNMCTSLEKVTIGSGLKELPLAAFDSCSLLHTVSMGQNIEIIGEQAFMYCTALKNISIPSKVTAIEKSAFTYCEALEELTMPNSLLTIGRDAFAGCRGLKKVTLGKNVKTIGMCAFNECESLESIVIPDSVEFIDDAAFAFCRSLKSAVLGKNITSIEERMFNECSSLESIIIPDSVETIDESAFGYCTSLKSVSIGRGVDTIGENAFSNCSALENVSMQYGVREIGRSAFMSTGPIAKLVIPDSVTTMGEYAFMYANLQNIVLGKGLYSIERGTFYFCNSLRSVNIPDNIEYIGENAFADNESLAKVVIGDGVSEIGESAFAYCKSLKTADIGSGVRTINYSAFTDCDALQSVNLSEGIEIIGDNAFSSCESLTEIVIPGSTREIGDYAFNWCTSLAKVEMGAAVSEIGSYAFNYCSPLKEIHIPVSVETLGGSILAGTAVTDVYYGGTEAQWYKLMETSWLGTNDATIHFGMKSDNVSTSTTKSIYSNRRHHIVYKNLNGMDDVNDDYVICTDAVISFDGQTYPADENGIVPMPKTSDITVSAPGYRTEVLEYSDYMNGLGIFLEKETDLPIIKSVELGKDEVRRSSEKFTKKREAQFWADVDTNGHTGCEIYIENGDNKWTINGSNGGYSTTINIGEEYNSWNDSYIVVEMADGRKISKKINIGYVPAAKEKPVISFGDSITNIGDNEIPYLNQMKFDFSIPNFPFDFTIEDDKIVATFGVDISKWKYKSGSGWDNQYNAHKTLAEVIKNSHERMEDEESIVDEYNKLVKEIGGIKTGGKAKLGFDANISAVGYLEGTIDEKGIFFSDGGVIFVAEGEVGPEGQGIIVIGPAPVPYNWEIKFKGKIEAQLQVAQREARSEELTPQGTLGGSVGLKAGIGPGLSDVHINACIEGTLDPKYTFTYNSSDFKLEAGVGVFVEAVLGPWKHKFGPKPIKVQLYPKADTAASELGSFSIYDVDEFTVIDRDYLNTPQEFTANDSVVRAFSDSKVDETVIKTNTFPVADPKMTDLGSGKHIIVWVDEDMTADEYNGRTIMYSYYDGSVWTEDVYVEQDGMSDFNPQLKTVGGKVYLVWESVDAVMSAASDVNDMYANMEIKYAVFDESTGKFTDSIKLSDNTCTDRAPVISDINGSAVITWVNKSESDVFTANSNNSLCYAVVDGETVVKTETAKTGLNHIESHIAQGSADAVEILYIADTDNSLENTVDNELFSTYYGQLTDDNNIKSALQMIDGEVYLYNGGKLMTYCSGNMNDTGIALLNDRFIITESDKTVVYLDGSGAASDVYAYFFDMTENSYGKPVKLTDTGMCLEDISGYTNESGQLVLAFGRRHITGDLESDDGTLYGASDVACVTVTPTYDIVLDYAFADANNMMPGFDTIIEADITNCGSKTVDSVTVMLYDEDGTLIVEGDDNITLLPGESGTAELVYTVPEDFIGFNGRVSVSVANEYDMDNNSYDVSLMCRDIEIRDVSYTPALNGEYNIYAEVANNSFKTENGIKVQLTKDNVTVTEKTVEAVGSLESVVVTFEGIADEGMYKIVVAELEDETMIGNNDEYVMIASEEDGFAYAIDNVSIKTSGDMINIAADVIADEVVTEKASLIVALYDRQGILVSSKMIPVQFDNETVKPVDENMEACEFESAKLMLWNSSNKPLAAVIE